MRSVVRGAVAAAVLVGGAVSLLGGCADGATAEQPARPPSASPNTPSTAPLPVASDPVPLGLEVRYVDERGRFVTMSPEDFPR